MTTTATSMTEWTADGATDEMAGAADQMSR